MTVSRRTFLKSTAAIAPRSSPHLPGVQALEILLTTV